MPWPFGVLAEKIGTLGQCTLIHGHHCSLKKKKGDYGPGSMQSVVGNFTLLLWFWRRGVIPWVRHSRAPLLLHPWHTLERAILF